VTFQLRFHRMDRSRSHDAVIRFYGEAGNVIETREHTGDFKELYPVRHGSEEAQQDL
jgi:hypothetical protein